VDGERFNVGDLVYYNDFEVGDLVYYNGFEIFEPRKKYIGVVVGQTFEEHYRGEDHYNVFWFDSSLTTRMHYANILKVYDEKGRG
jgi:hypothetical protein